MSSTQLLIMFFREYLVFNVVSMIADVAGKVVQRSTFLTKLKDDEGDSDARIMWKYSCSSK